VPLLVVPLAPDEAGQITLDEWDALCSCGRVFFERPGHPLEERLRAAGVAAAPFDDEPDARANGCALVADPSSLRIVELARAGARVSGGSARPPDDLSAAHAAPVARRAGAALGTLGIIMARLRSDDGCPWDREQTHESLEVHLLEEAHEVLEAIDRNELDAELLEELGDVLLQVAFHARIAEQDGRFDLASVADGISGKLIHRHPHVFGETQVADAAEVLRNWESIKAAEKTRDDPFEDIPKSLPGLLAAYKTQKRAARLGWHAEASEAEARVTGALASGSIGEALFWLVAVARAAGSDPETALLRATAEFRAGLSGDPGSS
jgi:XTP/dITP diphosphohydrolase